MKDLKFNIYGYTSPQTHSEYAALLREALLIADDLLDDIKRIGDVLEKRSDRASIA